MINLSEYIMSEDTGINTLLHRTWSKVNDGDGPDGVYRSHQIGLGFGGFLIRPKQLGAILHIQQIEFAFGVTGWSGNTAPSNFAFQYTNDNTAKQNDAFNDSRWITTHHYTSWNHNSGIVKINTDFKCRAMRIYVFSGYQSSYWLATVFRIHGEYISIRQLVEDGDSLKSFKQVVTRGSSFLNFAGGTSTYGILRNIPMPATEFMVEQWMKPSALTRTQSNFSYAISGQDNELLIHLYGTTLYVYVGGTGIQLPMTIPYQEYFHLVVGWRSADGNIQVYINGNLVYETYGFRTGFSIRQNGTLVIGQDQDSVGGGFDSNDAFVGQIGPTRVWNRTLSISEIRYYMKNGVTGTEPNLMMAYELLEESGTTITDSVNGRVMTLNNLTWVTKVPLFTETHFMTVGTKDELSEEFFLVEGFIDSISLDENVIASLESDAPRILVYSNREEYPKVKSTAAPFPQVIHQLTDIRTETIQEIKWAQFNAILRGGGKVHILFSFDEGNTWYAHDLFATPKWQLVDNEMLNVSMFPYVGITPAQFSDIVQEDWQHVLDTSKTIRMALYLSIEKATDEAAVAGFNFYMDLYGKWRHYKEAKWKYKSEELIVTLPKSGNFKINYYS